MRNLSNLNLNKILDKVLKEILNDDKFENLDSMGWATLISELNKEGLTLDLERIVEIDSKEKLINLIETKKNS